ncbi:neuroblastoma breakpoint family member 9 isoform X1 [Pan troglodytes]|uniref:neuroblastoma breakpoint family member 9 isoform X1 n=1 Tax=Pan troglodytes TaxID=9598 RepID=UPI00301326DD
MVVSAGPLSSEKAEMNILEINEKLRPQLAEKKQQFRNLQEKCFVTQLAGFLAKGQKKYKYEECEDLIKSMLRNERRQFKEEKLAEQLKQAEALRQYKVLVHSQERELTQLKEKLREGRDASRSLHEHLQALLTPDEPDKSQGQDLQEQLAEGCRLAQQLVQKLSPENDNDDDEDVQVEVAEKVQKSSAPREMQKAEEKEVPEDSLEECAITCSNSHGPYDSNQPHRKTKITFEEDKVDSTLIGSSSHVEWEDAVHIIPENESDDEEEEEKGPVSPRLSRELLEVVEPEVLQDSLDRCYSTPSVYLGLTDSCQPYRSAFYVLEQQSVGLAVDMDEIEKYQEVEEDQDPSCPRLSRELLDEKGPEVLQDSLDRCYSTPSGYLELPDLGQPYSSAVYSLEEQYLGLALDVDRIKKDQEEEEDQGPPCPRLSRELLEVVEPEVLQDSVDRCYSTPSSCLEQPDSCQPYGSSFYALEEKHVGFSLDVGEIEKKGKGKKRRGRRSKKKRRRGRKEGEEDQNPPCPRLNGVLMEVEEPEVLQDSLDRCYSTPSMYFELPDSFQHYRSVFYSFEEQHISFALYVDNRFFTLTVTSLHVVFQMEVIFPQ